MLLQCPECSNSVSDQAPSCPKCGVPLDVAGNKLKAKPSRTLIFSLVVPLLYVSINSFSILDQRSKFEEYVRSENNPMFNYEGTGLAPGALEYAKTPRIEKAYPIF